jgi:hypothetical protein
MEAKVDVRKLQILNDRINQTIEALNQVRLSVHGLGHSALQNPYPGGTGAPFPGTQNPYQNMGGPLSQLHTQLGQQGFPSGMGFQHSPFTPQQANPLVNPYVTNPMSLWGQGVPSPFQGAQNPLQGVPSPFTGGQQGGLGGVAGTGGGLFHSSPDIIDRQIAEARASDPQRITQTFPFVSY